MKPLSVEMACLLGIQNEIQAVCNAGSVSPINDLFLPFGGNLLTLLRFSSPHILLAPNT